MPNGARAAVPDRALDAVAAALLALAAAVALLQVFYRYALDNALPWPEELAQLAFVWAIFIAAGVATGRRGHIAIEVFSRLLGPRGRTVHRLFVDAASVATGMVLLIEGIRLVSRTTYVTPGLGLPMQVLHAAVPVGGLLIAVYALREARTAGAGLLALALVAVVGIGIYPLWSALGPYVGQQTAAPILVAVSLGLIALEVPVAFAFVLGAFAAFAPQGELMLITIPQNASSSIYSFTLLAIPFFILAAAIMNASRITERLIDVATRMVGHLRGGLGHVNVVTNTMMAGISGSSMADAAAIAKILVPEMARRGYSPAFGCALTSASATLANLIPPSLGLIIYGALASASVGALFVATIVPGLMTAAALALVVHVVSGRRGYGRDIPRADAKARWHALLVALPALFLPVAIVGGVRAGIFTATESGAIAAAYALFCGALIYRSLTPRNLLAALRDALHDTVAVTIVIAAAAPFAWVLTAEQVPQKVAQAVGAFATTPLLLLMTINVFLLVVGLFMEMIAAMVILVPILVPMVKAVGIDPIHFGIVLVMNLVIGALTPPLGMLVFTTARVGHVPVSEVFRAVVPLIAALLVVLGLVTYVPELTLAAVRWIGP